MSRARDLRGQGNGAGLAIGKAHIGPDPFAPLPANGSAGALLAAIEAAVADLHALMRVSDARSREILEFQVEMLSDPAIRDMGAMRRDAGEDAILAWVSALERYIADFEQSDDDDVRARAMDVIDLRNRVLGVLTGDRPADFPAGSILVATDVAPSFFLGHDWSQGGGIVLRGGSLASHVALLARSRAIPMVVGVGEVALSNGTTLLVDAGQGRVTVDPSEAETAAVRRHRETTLTGVTQGDQASGQTGIDLLVNIGDPSELATIGADCAGIGLLRSEFLMSSASDLANEERQYRLYREALAWAGDRPVTVRLLDLGGDKQIGGFGDGERNPFLGVRGIRLLLAQPDLLRVQARALLRAADHGNLRVMLPMVSIPAEIDGTRLIFAEEAERLAGRHVRTRMPAIGMMVEVPAAALMLDRFTQADFFSLGTNDLAQYVMAAARDGDAVAELYAQARPALLRLIGGAVRTAAEMGKPIGICGDLAGEIDALPLLLAAGLTQISVAPLQLAAIKTALAHVKAGN